MNNIDLSHIRGINTRIIKVKSQKHSPGSSVDPSTVQEKPARKESTKRTRFERRVSFTKCKKGHCDFLKLASPKPAKMVNQAVSGFTLFTTFKLANSEKSHRVAVTQRRPKFVSVCGDQYV